MANVLTVFASLRKYSATHRHCFILPFAIDKTFIAAYLLRLLLTSDYLCVRFGKRKE